MAETVVGLFEHPGTAEAVVDALLANGLPSKGIRALSKPVAATVDSATTTPGLDFAAALARDLSSMGATDRECEAYLAGVRRGNVLVFVNGSRAQVETALTVMNAYEPIEIEEFAFTGQALPSLPTGESVIHESNRLKSDREKAKSEGVRVFSW